MNSDTDTTTNWAAIDTAVCLDVLTSVTKVQEMDLSERTNLLCQDVIDAICFELYLVRNLRVTRNEAGTFTV